MKVTFRPASEGSGAEIGYRSGSATDVGLRENAGETPSDEGVIIHEFGHALGFEHEFARPDWYESESGGCRKRGTVDDGDYLGTDRDRDSIMVATGYCQSRDELSPWDIVGAQNLYGRKRGGLLVGLENYCVDIPGGSPGNGEDLQVYECHGADNQRWSWRLSQQFTPTSFGAYAMDVAGGNGAGNRADVQVFTKKDPVSANQQFSFEGVELIGMGGMCLDASQSDPEKVQLYTCHGRSNQRWNVTPIGLLSGQALLQIRQGSRCLEVRDGSTASGTLLDLEPCLGVSGQFFKWSSNGAIEWSGMCVDVKGGKPVDGARLQLYGCKSESSDSVANQRFHMRGAIRSLNRCLDIRGGNPMNRAELQIYDCKDSGNQIWEYYPDIRG